VAVRWPVRNRCRIPRGGSDIFVDINETDLELVRRYARDRAEDAFTEIVRRYLNLVYSAALRQVRFSQLAEEVAQSAFTDLTRAAARLEPYTILSAWLYQVTRRTAIDAVRREARRQVREQIATEMNALNATDDEWTRIEPLLDEAMSTLDAPDRAAVLLRYFENKSLREVGQQLRVSDDAAQKRVSRAVERLRDFFAKRGVTIGASGLVAGITANAVQAAPVGLAGAISATAALGGTAGLTTTAITTTKTIAMTTLQKNLIAGTLAAAIGTGIYETHRALASGSQVQVFQQQQAPLQEQIERLTQERDAAVRKLAELQSDKERLSREAVELPKLRGEVTRLRALEQQFGQLRASATNREDPFTQSILTLTMRAGELNQHLQRMPDKKIPELRYLTESDWLTVARDASFQSDAEISRALSQLRSLAKNNFGTYAAHALDKFIAAQNGQLPTEVPQLKPYFEVPVDDDTLQRYRLLHTGAANSFQDPWVLSEKAPVDRDYDSHLYVGPHGASGSFGTGGGGKDGPDAWATP
jgi:RNA polymerase sigma factor (sigma-70 family)